MFTNSKGDFWLKTILWEFNNIYILYILYNILYFYMYIFVLPCLWSSGLDEGWWSSRPYAACSPIGSLGCSCNLSVSIIFATTITLASSSKWESGWPTFIQKINLLTYMRDLHSITNRLEKNTFLLDWS